MEYNSLDSFENKISNIGSHTTWNKIDSRAIGLLMLENSFVRKQCRMLTQSVFMGRLKQMATEDLIEISEIGPLTRNSQPNESIVSVKNISSDSLTRSVNNFRECSRRLTNEEMLTMYKAKINEIQKIAADFKQQKKYLEERQADIVRRLKGLKFQSLSVSEKSCQTEVNLQSIAMKQTELQHLKRDIEEKQEMFETAQKQRENYLGFLEEVVNKKEEQLDIRHSEFVKLQQKLDADDVRYRLEPLSHLVDSKALFQFFSLLKDRIYEAVCNYEAGDKDALQLLENHPLYELFNKYDKFNSPNENYIKMSILKSLEVNCLQIRYKLQVAQEYFREQFARVVQLRQALEDKNTKFTELSSYQKYLDRYKELLECKEKEVEAKRANLNISSGDFKETSQRLRIFDKKDTSLISNGTDFDNERKYLSVKVNQMKQEYQKRIDSYKVLEKPLLEEVKQLRLENSNLKEMIAVKPNNSTETNLEQVIRDAKNKQLVVKYMTLWLEFGFKKNVKNGPLAKRLCFTLWRMRQYDPTILEKAENLVKEEYEQHEERLWDVSCSKEKKDKLYPYKSLTLKKKQFMEEFFDFQRKQFFKNRLRSMLRSIIRNKIRKERLFVVVAFHKFLRNCALNESNIVRPVTNMKPLANHKENKKKSISNSRTTLVYESNKNSQIKEKLEKSQTKTQLQPAENKHASQNHRIQYQMRMRRILACTKILTILEKENSRLLSRQTLFFCRWRSQCDVERGLARTRLLSERIEQMEFKMSAMQTKCRIVQSGITSKLALLEQLMVLAPQKD